MNDVSLFAQQLPFDPQMDFDAFLLAAPAKWAVYLFVDGDAKPFQLLAVKNLRASLANRLAIRPEEENTKAIPYRRVVRRIDYTPVNSQAEADWIYAQAARALFPAAYVKLIDAWKTYFIQIDLQAKFPRFTITNTPDPDLMHTTFGPLFNKSSAQACLKIIEDSMDLCRHYHILTQTPHGQACAYKQMHKCPAPCDGSISFPMYRQMLDMAVAVLGNERPAFAHTQRMNQAAAMLDFETAGKIKGFIARLTKLSYLKNILHLRHIAVVRGGTTGSFKLVLLTPEAVRFSPECTHAKELADTIDDYQRIIENPTPWNDNDQLQYIARVDMLKNSDMVFCDSNSSAIATAIKQLARRKNKPIDTDPDLETLPTSQME